MIVALAGGVGGARLAVGLAAVLPPSRLVVVVNTGDDFEHMGLSVCPDLDTVLYTIAGIANSATGWGRADETWRFMAEAARLGGESWFRLGDRDLAMHVLRSEALRRGEPLSGVTRRLARKLGIRHRIFPMSDTAVRTRVRTADGELAFQDYFVRRRCRPRVTGFRFAGAHAARPPRELAELMASGRTRAVVICPSNPYVSIAPILAVPAISDYLKRRDFPVVAVSPLVGGAALKGPAAKMMRELGARPGVAELARYYGSRVDGWVIDRRDAAARGRLEAADKPVLVTDTIMSDSRRSAVLAQEVLAFARAAPGRRGAP